MLSRAIREECGEFRGHLDDLSDAAMELCGDSAGINGLTAFWRGLHQQLRAIAKTVEEREKEVLASLEGKAKPRTGPVFEAEEPESEEAVQEAAS